MITNKEIYRNWVKQTGVSVPLFLEPWWLDAVALDGRMGNWDVALTQTADGKMQGVLPYFESFFLKQRLIQTPPLTPFMGPLLFYPENLNKKSSLYAFEKRVLGQLIEQLPSFLYFSQRFFPAASGNCLPFLWKNFKQSNYYTYILPAAKDEQSAWEQLDARNRKILKRTENGISVEACEEPSVMYAVLQNSYALQKKKVPFSSALLEAADNALKERERRQIWLARGKNAQITAVLYLVWDKFSLYTLALGRNGRLFEDGSYERLLWEAVKLSVVTGRPLNFCGSSTARFERKLRLFGGVLTPYALVYKGRNRWVEALRLLRGSIA